MIRGFFCLFFAFITWSSSAQFLNNVLLPDTVIKNIQLTVHFDANASGISNNSLNKAYSGGLFSGDDISKVSDKLNDHNRLGYENLVGVAYTQPLDSGTFSYYQIVAQHQQIVFAGVSGDAVKIVLGGNKQFEDQQANIELSYRYQNIQRIGVNLGTTQGKLRYQVGGSLLHGSQRHQLNVADSWLYTAPHAEYLESEVHYSSSFSDGTFGSGIGMELNGVVTYQMEKSAFTASAQNVGGIMWFSNTQQTLDSIYRFEGLKIDNVLSPQELNTENLNADSLTNLLGLSEDKKGVFDITPMRLQLQWDQDLNAKWSTQLGAMFIPGFNALPLFYAKANYKINPSMMLSPVITYGGFGTYNVGLGFNKQFNKLRLGVDCRYLDGLMLSKSKAGVGGVIRIGYNL